MTIRLPRYSQAEDEALNRVMRLLGALQGGVPPNKADRDWLDGFLQKLIVDQRNPARKYFGLPVQRGRPSDAGQVLKVKAYVTLARLMGHTAAKAIEHATEEFGYEDSRSVEKIIAGFTFSNPNATTQEEEVLWLKSHLEAQHAPLPPLATVKRSKQRPAHKKAPGRKS